MVGGATYAAGKSQKAPGQAAAVNPGQTTAEAIASNNANTPEIEALLRRANSFTQQQNLSLLNQAIPGYGQIAQNLSNQALQASENPYGLPKEFSDNLARQAAERGINTGVRGQAGDFSLLRDFGINSLQYGQQQLQSSQNILQTLAGLGKVNPLSPLSMYIQPGQALQGAYQQQSADQSYLNASQAAANKQAAAGWNGLAAGAGVFGGMYGGGTQQAATTVGSTFDRGGAVGTYNNPYVRQ